MAKGDFGMPVIDDAVFKIKIKILQICRINILSDHIYRRLLKTTNMQKSIFCDGAKLLAQSSMHLNKIK
jgi:hypothetical protein